MRWTHRPPGSNWGEFGPDDQLGRANLIGPEQVRKGAQEVIAGLSFCLSLPLDYPGGSALNPRRHPPVLRPTWRDGRAGRVHYLNYPLAAVDADATDVICDDTVLLSLQYSTQWDALAHVGALFDADGDGRAERVYYNGYRADEHIHGPARYDERGQRLDAALANPHDGDDGCGGASRADALGIENMAVKCMQGRGVLIDLAAHFGREHRAVNYEDLRTVIDRDGVTIEAGDMLLLHTGFADMLLEMRRDPDPHALHHSCCALDGRDPRLLQWITDSGIAALAADNYAVERYPAQPAEGRRALLPLHEHCLFKLGLPLGELWHLGELAAWLRAHGRHRFNLTAPPLRLPGAVGSPLTPVATV